jgi:hypothetical protein
VTFELKYKDSSQAEGSQNHWFVELAGSSTNVTAII